MNDVGLYYSIYMECPEMENIQRAEKWLPEAEDGCGERLPWPWEIFLEWRTCSKIALCDGWTSLWIYYGPLIVLLEIGEFYGM